MIKRVLCVGFSVTEMTTSYVPVAQAICIREDLPFEFHKCGIGGVGIETLSYLINDILDMHSDFKLVVFELATGVGRVEFSRRQAEINDFSLMRHVEQIAKAAMRRGVAIGFLNLPRLDVDYGRDIMELSIFAVANKMAVPVLSLSYRALLGDVNLASMLPDKVHVNEAGAEFYARALIELVSNGLSKAHTTLNLPNTYCSYTLAQGREPRAFFERHGFSTALVQLEPGRSIMWSPPSRVTLRGVTFLSGPLSGEFELVVDGRPLDRVQSYDQYCYYERFNSAFVHPVLASHISIKLMASIPSVELIKGERDCSSRVMSFGHLLYSPAEVLN